MAEREKLDLGGEKPKSSSKRLIFIVIGLVLAVALAVLATLYFLGFLPVGGPGGDGHGKVGAKMGKELEKKPPIYLSLAPSFTANFKNNPDARLVQIELTVASTDQDVLETITKHMPMLRNNILMVLAGADPSILKAQEGKEALRKKIKAEIEKVVTEQSGSKKGVDDVFFTGFVMQ